jgi:hypothetical protein
VTIERADAYAHVIRTLDNVAPAKLHPQELSLLRPRARLMAQLPALNLDADGEFPVPARCAPARRGYVSIPPTEPRVTAVRPLAPRPSPRAPGHVHCRCRIEILESA